MAARRVTNKKFKREKVKRITKTEEYLINSKYLGDEPVYSSTKILDEAELGKIYNWYAYMCTVSDARQYIIDFMNKIGKKQVAASIEKIHDNKIPLTAGWICRILHRGGKLTDRSKEFMLSRVKACVEFNTNAEIVEKKQVKVPHDIQRSIRDKARDVIGSIESMIDSREEFSVYEYMQKNELPAMYASYVVEYYEKQLNEFIEASTTKDEQLKEGYKKFGRVKLKKMIDQYTSIVEDAKRYGDNTKKVRKVTRKPKVMTNERLMKNFKFKKEDHELKLVSVNPESIIGAEELWAYNTKNKILSVFRAVDRGGLSIKTVHVTNVDEKACLSKRLRKPEEAIAKLLQAGKIGLKKFMDELTTKPSYFTTRISSDTVLLRIVK
jgi:hypothetical protein